MPLYCLLGIKLWARSGPTPQSCLLTCSWCPRALSLAQLLLFRTEAESKCCSPYPVLTFISWLFNALKSVWCLKFSYVCQNSITPEDYTKIIKVVNSRICSEINEAQQRPYLTGEIKVGACWQTLTVEHNVASSHWRLGSNWNLC